MKKILVLGAGMVGRTIAIDLAKKHAVTSADISDTALNKLPGNIKKIEADLSDTSKVKSLCHDFDLIVSAVPGFMGYSTLEAIIAAGKNVVDISFFPEDAFELDALAKEMNITAVVDCGVAPGMSNLILGYYNNQIDVDVFKCYVGGLPCKREFPFQYKAPFSPVDVIEEYTRPARFVANGKLVTKPAMSDLELIDFEDVGTLEAFNSDGLRTLIKTMNVPLMIEKTLRYPGHIEYIQVLKSAGFFDEKEIEINGTKISPREFTSKILFDKWHLNDDDLEFTIMRIIIKGKKDGQAVIYTYDMFDRRDSETGFSSMSRTTGFTACAAAELLLDGKYTKDGITPPEFLGKDETNFRFIMDYLAARNVIYKLTAEE